MPTMMPTSYMTLLHSHVAEQRRHGKMNHITPISVIYWRGADGWLRPPRPPKRRSSCDVLPRSRMISIQECLIIVILAYHRQYAEITRASLMPRFEVYLKYLMRRGVKRHHEEAACRASRQSLSMARLAALSARVCGCKPWLE